MKIKKCKNIEEDKYALSIDFNEDRFHLFSIMDKYGRKAQIDIKFRRFRKPKLVLKEI